MQLKLAAVHFSSSQFPLYCADKMTENYSEQGTSFCDVLVCNEMVQKISINDLLLLKSKQKHHFNAKSLSLTENVFNTLPFPSGIDVVLSSENVDLSQENGIELEDDASIFSI